MSGQTRQKGQHGVVIFYLIAFTWSWLFWIPAALLANDVFSSPALAGLLLSPLNPAPWGPLLSALLVTYLESGRQGLKDLLRRGAKFRFSKAWYLPIFLLFPFLIGGSLLLALAMGEPAPPMEALANPAVLPIAFVYILLLGGPLQEEFGWRGYALDRLRTRWNALVSSLIVGFLWGAWHLPLFFIPGETIYYEKPIWGLLLTTMLVSIFFTWIYNNTGRSIFAVLLFHTMFNWSHYVFPALEVERAGEYLWYMQLAMVIIVLAIWGTRHMVRSENGSRPDKATRRGTDPWPVRLRSWLQATHDIGQIG